MDISIGIDQHRGIGLNSIVVSYRIEKPGKKECNIFIEKLIFVDFFTITVLGYDVIRRIANDLAFATKIHLITASDFDSD